jgi:hypothetical protein
MAGKIAAETARKNDISYLAAYQHACNALSYGKGFNSDLSKPN